ncbi:hypothetical protein B0H16DRAFT_1827563 [Mycena metata]|uniref:Uncharacterized protein n=1 Tax=Mycena metata TaxID=1033252 RepID=A0AAD7GU18_9AGAR|nr:hypothetical protein B0H16DRAFT_1827563 [Mycena metata]
MSLNGHPSATPAQPLPPLPAGWGGPPSTPSPYQLPPAPTNSDGWGSSPTTVPRSDDTPLPQTYTPSSSHDGYNTLFPAPIIKPLFIDTLARDMKLEEGQRQNLHDFVQLGSAGAGLSQADLATRLYALAVTFSDIAERRRTLAAETPTDWKSLWRDLSIRLDGSFAFTKDQERQKNIRGIARDIIIEPSRTVYTTMHIDVLAAIKKRPESLALDNVAGVPAREQALTSQVKSAGSSVRNALRKEIIGSIDPENWVSLAQFSYDCVSKYKLGGAGIDISDSYTAHIALLRRFAFDHPGLKPEPAASSAAADDDDTRPTKKARTSKKGAQAGGRIAAGEDFWGQVDEYFRNEIKTRGKNLTGSKWKSYIDRIISDDNSKFRGKQPGSPIEPLRGNQPEAGVEGATVSSASGDMSGASARPALASLL